MHTIAELDYGQIQAEYELDVYGKRGITLVSGEGALVEDSKGKTYIDCIAGHGCANLGHNHQRISITLQEQASRLMSCPGSFANDQRALYMRELLAVAPSSLNRVFLSNSGTESIEAALKFARISSGRTRFVAARRGFHGRSYGAMSATYDPRYSAGSEPLVPGFTHIPFNDTDALRTVMSDDVAGVILEVIQGEGGVRLAQPSFLEEARTLCDRHGAYLIIDEVQTGFGRTGQLFACDQYNLEPDILCLAKSIAGGFPMGATLVSERVQVPPGRHGSTFGGNPLACALARTTLDVLQREHLAQEARWKGMYLMDRFQRARLDVVREIRGAGLMIGLELRTRSRPYLKRLMEAGVLALPAGATVLRLLPPLIIDRDQLARVADILIEVLEKPQ